MLLIFCTAAVSGVLDGDLDPTGIACLGARSLFWGVLQSIQNHFNWFDFFLNSFFCMQLLKLEGINGIVKSCCKCCALSACVTSGSWKEDPTKWARLSSLFLLQNCRYGLGDSNTIAFRQIWYPDLRGIDKKLQLPLYLYSEGGEKWRKKSHFKVIRTESNDSSSWARILCAWYMTLVFVPTGLGLIMLGYLIVVIYMTL